MPDKAAVCRIMPGKAVVAGIVLLWCAASQAAQITVEYGYTPPTSPPVAGYRLYRDGLPICATADPAARSLACIVPDAPASFTLTAAFADGSESPHSAAVHWSGALVTHRIGLPVIQSIHLIHLE